MRRHFPLLAPGLWVACAVALTAAGCVPAGQSRFAQMDAAHRLLAAEAAGPNAEGAAGTLQALLESDDLLYRAAAAETLGAWAARGNPATVLPAVAHKDPLVRAVAQAAYREHSRRGLAPLALGGACVEVEPAVLTALGELYDPQAAGDAETLIASQRAALRQRLEADPAQAALAADVLARIGDAAARRKLVRLVESEESLVAAKAARACVRGTMGLGPTLLPTAFGGGATVRRAVMQALVTRPDPRLKNLMVQGLTDRDRPTRRNAIRALGNLGGAAPLERLAERLRGPREERLDVIRALGAVGRSAADTLRRYIREGPASDRLEVEALLALAPNANRDDVSWIAKRLESPNKHVRGAAASALGYIGHPSAQAALMRRVADPEPLVRATAARALGQIGTVYAGKQLVVMLGDPSALVRSMAAWGLGEAGYPDAVPALVEMAKAPAATADRPVRVGGVYGRPALAAVEALGKIATEPAVTALVAILESPSWLIRAEAAKGLGLARAPRPEVLDALEKHLNDPVNLVQAHALLSLKALGKTFPAGHFQTR